MVSQFTQTYAYICDESIDMMRVLCKKLPWKEPWLSSKWRVERERQARSREIGEMTDRKNDDREKRRNDEREMYIEWEEDWESIFVIRGIGQVCVNRPEVYEFPFPCLKNLIQTQDYRMGSPFPFIKPINLQPNTLIVFFLWNGNSLKFELLAGKMST